MTAEQHDTPLDEALVEAERYLKWPELPPSKRITLLIAQEYVRLSREARLSERLPLDQIEEAAINMACPVGFVTYLRGLKIADPQELRTTTASPVSDSPTPAESASSSRYALSYTPPEVFAPSQSERPAE